MSLYGSFQDFKEAIESCRSRPLTVAPSYSFSEAFVEFGFYPLGRWEHAGRTNFSRLCISFTLLALFVLLHLPAVHYLSHFDSLSAMPMPWQYIVICSRGPSTCVVHLTVISLPCPVTVVACRYPLATSQAERRTRPCSIAIHITWCDRPTR